MKKKTENIKADISLGNTKKEREEVVKRINRTQRLFKQFGVQVYAFDPGVRCYILGIGGPKADLDFGGNEWKWLEPLLKELVQWRGYGKKFNMYMSKKERRRNEVASKKS